MSGYDEVDEMIEKVKSNAMKRKIEHILSELNDAKNDDDTVRILQLIASIGEVKEQAKSELDERRRKRDGKRLARSS